MNIDEHDEQSDDARDTPLDLSADAPREYDDGPIDECHGGADAEDFRDGRVPSNGFQVAIGFVVYLLIGGFFMMISPVLGSMDPPVDGWLWGYGIGCVASLLIAAAVGHGYGWWRVWKGVVLGIGVVTALGGLAAFTLFAICFAALGGAGGH